MLKGIDVDMLTSMKTDDIRELLVEEKLNHQDLRELIYRLVGSCNTYKAAFEYQRNLNEELESKIERFKDTINLL